MNKHITDEKTGISYTMQGDYYLPDLALSPEEEQPIGVWGQRHLRYIRQHKRLLHANLLTSGKLNGKAENQMPWVGKMNAIREAVTEIVNNDLIYA